ncbi:hypothetical protein CFP56_030501, partial [Quercus suber]
MDSRHYSLYTNVLRGNINLEEQLFGVCENSPMFVQDSTLNDEVATSKEKTTRVPFVIKEVASSTLFNGFSVLVN